MLVRGVDEGAAGTGEEAQTADREELCGVVDWWRHIGARGVGWGGAQGGASGGVGVCARRTRSSFPTGLGLELMLRGGGDRASNFCIP